MWSGDVDLNNGLLQQQYRDFSARFKFIEGIGVGERDERRICGKDLETIVKSTSDDLEWCLKK